MLYTGLVRECTWNIFTSRSERSVLIILVALKCEGVLFGNIIISSLNPKGWGFSTTTVLLCPNFLKPAVIPVPTPKFPICTIFRLSYLEIFLFFIDFIYIYLSIQYTNKSCTIGIKPAMYCTFRNFGLFSYNSLAFDSKIIWAWFLSFFINLLSIWYSIPFNIPFSFLLGKLL